MPRRKKTFACGHRGYGQSCQHCAQIESAKAESLRILTEKQQQKLAWKSRFDDDPIDLRELPEYVVLKAREILAALRDRQDYRDFGGKRLRHDRQIISIPVTRNYRMICQDTGTAVVPQAVVSHEDYNVCKPRA
ncbi:MAG: hypothetical protein HC918_13080 [Oscillatoriales cyanobacterium SM2_1_8]|nr:hypothetical protein [Oscillatoriales cyanobacterium SM2_1_8]